jgi:hypothetical protein
MVAEKRVSRARRDHLHVGECSFLVWADKLCPYCGAKLTYNLVTDFYRCDECFGCGKFYRYKTYFKEEGE